MKKNRMMRLASVLLVLVLLSTSVISGTFAKYTTSDNSYDSARVAKWGFEATEASITLDNLFVNAYNEKGTKTVEGASSADVIAPGTANSVDFSFAYDTASNGVSAPEVGYTFNVKAETNKTADKYAKLDANQNFVWTLKGPTGTDYATEKPFQKMEDLLDAINSLDDVAGTGAGTYAPGTLPTKFYGTDASAATWTIGWSWAFGDDSTTAVYDLDNDGTAETSQNQFDTSMGNADALNELQITITITATQVD